MTLMLFASFTVLMLIGVPIGISIGSAAILAIYFNTNVPLIVVSQTMFNGINNFPLMAIPFFILAGNLMSAGGLSKKLINFANLFIARYTGGLANVAIGASMMFGSISGSAPATTAAIGGVMVKEMEKNGYDKPFTAATVAAAGTVGMVIPPSIPMVTYCVLAGTSVSTLFLMGIGPGILMGLSMMVVAYMHAKKHNIPKINVQLSVGILLRTIIDSMLALIMPVMILGGIYGGIFTPTEAGAVAVVYGFIVGTFIYRDLNFSNLPNVFLDSAIASAVIMMIMATVATFSFVLTRAQIPHMIATAIINFTSNKYVILFLFNIILLVVGLFLQASPAIALLTPILLPVMTSVGISPYMVGIIFIVNLSIGQITPPVGQNLFVACNISGASFEDILKAIVPYVIALLICLLLITYIEPISMFLVRGRV
jgi:C4-dicarboxylate transporter DctM subunit